MHISPCLTVGALATAGLILGAPAVGPMFYGLRWRAWSNDPNFVDSNDDSAAYPAGVPEDHQTSR